MNNVRLSGLSVSIQESAFSLNISVRKSSLKTSSVHISDPTQNSLDCDSSNQMIKQLSYQCDFLEKANNKLKQEYEESVNKLEDLQYDADHAKKQLEDSKHISNTIKENRVKTSNEEKRKLQIKHKKLCATRP